MKTLHFLLLPAAMLCLAACKKNSDPPMTQPPFITGFIPTHGGYNTPLTIKGVSFGALGSEKTVKINGITMPVVSATDTSVTVQVPLKAGDGKISITGGGQTIETVGTFLYDYAISVSSIACDGSDGYLDGQGTAAKISHPLGMTIDSQDNLYVADQGNFCIRKISPQGLVSTFAGTPQSTGYQNGPGNVARFGYLRDIEYEKTEGAFYTIDMFHDTCRIRKITAGGQVSVFAGGGRGGEIVSNPLDATFNYPLTDYLGNMTIDANKNIYMAGSMSGSYLLKINSSGVSVFAGNPQHNGYLDGPGASALFALSFSNSIISTSDGNLLYFDIENHRFRKILLSGLVSTFAGNGSAALVDADNAPDASFSEDVSVMAQDSRGNTYIIENNQLRMITSQGRVITLTHNPYGYADGNNDAAKFFYPRGMVADSHDNLFLTDNNRIRKVVIH